METAGALGAFASAGLLGSDAGTSLKTALAALTPNSKKAADLMESLGISAYDAQGNFVGLAEFAGNLRESLAGMTDQQRQATMETIFGSDAVRAAGILYDQGAEGIQGWIDKVDDQGYAAEVAGIKLDNLKGDLEALGGAFETALIGTGGGSQGMFRDITQGATDTVNAFNALPGPIQTTTAAALGLTAVFGGGAWFTARTISGLTTTREALVNLGVDADKASKATRGLGRAFGATAGLGVLALGISNTNEALGTLEAGLGGAAAGLAVGGPWGAAVGGAIGLVVSLGVSHDNTAEQVAALTGTFDQQTGAITESTRAMIAQQAQKDGLLDSAQQLGLDTALVTEAIMGNVEAQEMLNAATADYDANYTITSVKDLAQSYSEQEIQQILAERSATKLREAIPGLADNFRTASHDAQQLAGAMSDVPGSADGAAAATDGYAESAQDAAAASREEAKTIRDGVEAMYAKRDATLAAFDAETAYRQALKEARAQADKNDAGIRGNTEAALNNRGALSQLAAAWNNQSDAVKNNGARFHESRKAFIDTAVAMGVPKAAAKALADQILDIPKARATKISAETAAANAAIEETKRRLAYLNGYVATTYVRTIRDTVGTGVGPAYRAGGGQVRGPGGPREDKIPAMLSDGEFVMQAAAVNRYGLALMNEFNSMQAPVGRSGLALAAGGVVACGAGWSSMEVTR